MHPGLSRMLVVIQLTRAYFFHCMTCLVSLRAVLFHDYLFMRSWIVFVQFGPVFAAMPLNDINDVVFDQLVLC